MNEPPTTYIKTKNINERPAVDLNHNEVDLYIRTLPDDR